MKSLIQDVRYAARALLRQPALTAAVVVTLALGVGLNGAVFSVVNAYLFQPLPVRDAGRIVMIGQTTPELQRPHEMSWPDIQDQRALDVYQDVAAWTNGAVNIGSSSGERAERIFVNETTANYFTLLGVEAVLGRTFAADEDQGHLAHRVLVLDYRFWQNHFQGDSSVVGRTLAVNGQSATIIGVAPESFHGVQAVLEPQGYMPLNQVAADYTAMMRGRDNGFLNVVARVRPGVRIGDAQAASAALGERIAREHPVTHAGTRVMVVPERLSRPHLFVSAFTPLASAIFMALSALVLIVACANVAGLLLSRAVARERELAVRAALGASRGGIARLLLVESLLLGVVGGLAALVVAVWCAGVLSSLRIATDAPVRFAVNADWRVFAFTLAIALAAGVLAGTAPALRGASRNLHDALRAGTRAGGSARQRLRSILVVAQVAVAVVVLSAAGMFLRSVQRAGQVDLGFNTSNVLLASLAPSDQGFTLARTRAFADRVLEQVAALPGIEAVAIARRTPLGFNSSSDRVEPEGGAAGGGSIVANTNVVSPGYFRALDIPLLDGRDFGPQDDSVGQRTVIVSEAFARQAWGAGSALGRRLRYTGDTTVVTVVGVVANSIWSSLGEPPRPFLYYPLGQSRLPDLTLNVRTTGDPAAAIASLRARMRELDANLPLYDVRTMRQHLDGGLAFFFLRLGASFAALFGLLALALGAVGLFGLIAFGVEQRVREIGIRMALGAEVGAVQRMMMNRGLRLVAIGLVIGLPLALFVARAMQGLLVNTPATDPLALGSGVALLVIVAGVASWLPARRAMRVDPMVALRSD